MPASVGGSELSLGRKMYVMSEGLATPLLHVRPLLHLLLLLPFSSSVPAVWSSDLLASDVIGQRAKRQDAGPRSWITAEFTNCSAACDGGFRVRSVRCLDEDGVIANDCIAMDRPANFEFCNQVDCVTNVPNTALPPFDTYNFTLADGASAVLMFEDIPLGEYQALLTVTEADGVMTTVNQTLTASGRRTSVRTSAASNSIEFRPVDGTVSLVVDGEGILGLEGLEVRDVVGSLQYDNDTISLTNGGGMVDDVDTFYYYDGFRFYQFNSSKINSLSGPGVLYVNPGSGTALYTTSSSFSAALSMAFDSFGISTIAVTSAVATPPATPTGQAPTTPTGQEPATPTEPSATTVTVVTSPTPIPSTIPTSVPGATTMVVTTPTTPTDAPGNGTSVTTQSTPASTRMPTPTVPPTVPKGGCPNGRARSRSRQSHSSDSSRTTAERSLDSSQSRSTRASTRKSRSPNSTQKSRKSGLTGRTGSSNAYTGCQITSRRGTPRKTSTRGTPTKQKTLSRGTPRKASNRGTPTKPKTRSREPPRRASNPPMKPKTLNRGTQRMSRRRQGAKNLAGWRTRVQSQRWALYRKIFFG